MTFDYHGIKLLAQKLGRNIPELLVLKDENDPFFASVPRRRERAEWFARLWEQFNFGTGTHLRRIHYRIVSQPLPIPMADGEPYENIEACWRILIWAGRDARYLGLVPIEHFIDQRNGETVIRLSEDEEEEANIYVTDNPRLVVPERPKVWLSKPTIKQPFHIEIIAEKSTVDDILVPLAERYGLNVTSCLGDISLTRCFEIIQRAKASGRPVRIFYISDFDPAGLGMPIGAARKLEFLIRDGGLDLDLQLHPVVLTAEQCRQYRLPRTPLKTTVRGAKAWEARFGEGATELDALEALHPGELRRILVSEIERYYDTTLNDRIAESRQRRRRRDRRSQRGRSCRI
jgi:hypothetical protein